MQLVSPEAHLLDSYVVVKPTSYLEDWAKVREEVEQAIAEDAIRGMQ